VPKFLLFLVALFWTGVVSYFCLIKSSEMPKIEIPNLDKYVHVFFHFVFTFVWFLFFRKQLITEKIIKPLVYSFLFSFTFGITIEILQQTITTTRNADIFDVIANSTGALLSVSFILISDKFNFLNFILKK
jgi:VanZ family protein